MRFPIGTKFVKRGRDSATWTVTDYWTTRNHAEEIVKTRYVASKPYIGGPLTDYDVPETTICLGNPVAPAAPQEVPQ